MRYYTVAYRHYKDGLCEWCRFSTREAADRCADFLQEASVAITGDEERAFFRVLTSAELDEYPADSVGQLTIDAFLSFG